ncbi:hypothetical protein GCM10011584_34090 [Nocardioides phosphati]|uniref:DUF8175 domain-containing protein n=1 Tax=Nocardioides phosphati TaxID=1867775 RepID=A0ABQ2NDN2_9ACTN|nr:hypothetical protein [Nocardioides phosphati]GGO94028.1 hypothetical protein GCM10011584_34090 [Nocardioides phosphati]
MSEEYGFVEKPSPWTRPSFIAAAGLLALIVVVGIVLSAIGVFGDDKAKDAAPAPTSSTTSTPSDPDASVCGLEGHETSGALGTAPKDVKWELVGRVALPSSKTAGPGRVEESGLRYCYARTKEGAVLAAANVYSWPAVTDDEGIVEHAVASGPGKTAVANSTRDGDADEGEGVSVQIRGFRLLSYSDTSAMVDFAFQNATTNSYVHASMEMAWEDGDWRVVLNPDGSFNPGSALPDLTGYVPWSGA